jgi:pilus assembly protein Flp/PilA
MRPLIRRFLRERAGATAIEYALIGVLLSMAAIVGFTTLANSVREAYTDQGEAVKTATDRYR